LGRIGTGSKVEEMGGESVLLPSPEHA